MEFILFILLLFFVFYLPGRFLLRLAKFQSLDLPQVVALSLGVGIASFLFFTYLLSWIKLDFIYNILVIFIGFFEIKMSFKECREKITMQKIMSLETAVILIGSFFMTYITYRSGIIVNGSMEFYGVNSTDAIYHISLIGNLKNNFPPTHPGIAGLSMHGYNFFYDFIIASFAKFYHLSIVNLFFRYFSFFISVLYGLSFLVLGRFLKFKKRAILILLLLAYFSQGFSFIFNSIHILYNAGIVQPIANIVDPSVILSVSILFLFTILLFSTKNVMQVLIAALLLGVLPMIKIYTGIMAFGALTILVGVALPRERNTTYIKILFLAIAIALSTYIPINLGSGKLIFTPFLLYTHFLQSYAQDNGFHLWEEIIIFTQHNNYIKIIYKYGIILFLFYIPTLGLRAVTLLFVGKMFSSRFYSYNNIFFLSMVMIGVIIPSFFIQSVAVFVIIQFLWITYFILLIPTAFCYEVIFKKMNKILLIPFVFFLIALNVPDTVALFYTYSQNPYRVDMHVIEQANAIQTYNTQNKGVIVLNVNYDNNKINYTYVVPLISALSSTSVYAEPELMEFSGVDKEIERRKNIVNQIQMLITRCADPFTVDNAISSIMENTHNEFILAFSKNVCVNKLKHFKIIHQSGESVLYKYIHI